MPKGAEELSQLQNESELPLNELLAKLRGSVDKDEEMEEEGEDDEEEEPEQENEGEGEGEGKTGKERINEAAAAATEAQPTGFTLSTTKVCP